MTEKTAAGRPGSAAGEALVYQTGLGNELETEAIAGTLPRGQNSPQKVAHGLVSELMSGTTFTAPRARSRRSYVFRIHPSVVHGRFERIDNNTLLTPPFDTPPAPHNYRWGPFGNEGNTDDFVDSLATLAAAGSPSSQTGVAVHVYAATRSMSDRVFSDADGELLVVPRAGDIRLCTEMGRLELAPGEIAVIPRGVKFRVELLGESAAGFVFENYGAPLSLPELGLIGTNGLANVADFQIPVAAYEDTDGPVQMVHKLGGSLWSAQLSYSPLDVVAWRGSLYPYKYDLDRFVPIGPLMTDHPDPSIFALLTSGGDPVLGPNFDVMALTPRWLVAEGTFRPPGYHRNCVAEFSLFLQGQFGKDVPAGTSALNNAWTPHGPATAVLEMAREAALAPQRIDDQKILLVESRFPFQVTGFAETVMPHIAEDGQFDGYTKTFTGVPDAAPRS